MGLGSRRIGTDQRDTSGVEEDRGSCGRCNDCGLVEFFRSSVGDSIILIIHRQPERRKKHIVEFITFKENQWIWSWSLYGSTNNWPMDLGRSLLPNITQVSMMK
jgi:hypothetical protein